MSCFVLDPQSAMLSLADADINAVAGLVKLFFRELPEPLFTNALYPKFVSGIREYSKFLDTSLYQ